MNKRGWTLLSKICQCPFKNLKTVQICLEDAQAACWLEWIRQDQSQTFASRVPSLPLGFLHMVRYFTLHVHVSVSSREDAAFFFHTGKNFNNYIWFQKNLLSCAKGYVLQHIRIWRISEGTHICENGQYSRPLLHKCIIQYTNAETYAHRARWGCELAVGKNTSSLSLSSLSGYWGQELM